MEIKVMFKEPWRLFIKRKGVEHYFFADKEYVLTPSLHHAAARAGAKLIEVKQ